MEALGEELLVVVGATVVVFRRGGALVAGAADRLVVADRRSATDGGLSSVNGLGVPPTEGDGVAGTSRTLTAGRSPAGTSTAGAFSSMLAIGSARGHIVTAPATSRSRSATSVTNRLRLPARTLETRAPRPEAFPSIAGASVCVCELRGSEVLAGTTVCAHSALARSPTGASAATFANIEHA